MPVDLMSSVFFVMGTFSGVLLAYVLVQNTRR